MLGGCDASDISMKVCLTIDERIDGDEESSGDDLVKRGIRGSIAGVIA